VNYFASGKAPSFLQPLVAGGFLLLCRNQNVECVRFVAVTQSGG
jgi:hypothetical protein